MPDLLDYLGFTEQMEVEEEQGGDNPFHLSYSSLCRCPCTSSAIDIESLPKTMANKQKLTKICEKMNMRTRNARDASRASFDYHTYLFFRVIELLLLVLMVFREKLWKKKLLYLTSVIMVLV